MNKKAIIDNLNKLDEHLNAVSSPDMLAKDTGLDEIISKSKEHLFDLDNELIACQPGVFDSREIMYAVVEKIERICAMVKTNKKFDANSILCDVKKSLKDLIQKLNG